MMSSSATDFRLLKAAIRCGKGKGKKLLVCLPEQEPSWPAVPGALLAAQFWDFVRGEVPSGSHLE